MGWVWFHGWLNGFLTRQVARIDQICSPQYPMCRITADGNSDPIARGPGRLYILTFGFGRMDWLLFLDQIAIVWNSSSISNIVPMNLRQPGCEFSGRLNIMGWWIGNFHPCSPKPSISKKATYGQWNWFLVCILYHMHTRWSIKVSGTQRSVSVSRGMRLKVSDAIYIEGNPLWTYPDPFTSWGRQSWSGASTFSGTQNKTQ